MRITDDYVFFWTGRDIYSNFYYSPFQHQGQVFKWAEQAIMYRKAMLFGAHKIAREIMAATNPAECKKLGRSRQIPFDNKVWDENKEKIFKEVLTDKFKTPKLKKQMLATGNRKFAEASPYDKIWGIGLHENDKDVLDESKWRGQNLLGKILTEIRDEMKNNV